MTVEELEIPFEEGLPQGRNALPALWMASSGSSARGSAVLLAHGAGGSMRSPFLETVAAGLAAGGLGVLRFNYPYRERALRAGKRMLPPDPPARLEASHRAALAALEELAPGRRPLLAGKSLGGRIGTHLAAAGAPAAGLVLFGYPLHPAKRPEQGRSGHFGAIAQPALFLQGERDALGTPGELRRALETFGGSWELVPIEGGDHDFAVPKKLGPGRAEVLAWESRTFPA